MGIFESKQQEPNTDSFTEKELKDIKNTYLNLQGINQSNSKSDQFLNQSINFNQFKILFKNDEIFSENLFKWFQKIQNESPKNTAQKHQSDQITFNTLISCLEFILQSPKSFQNPFFNKFPKYSNLEFFLIILIDQSQLGNFNKSETYLNEQKVKTLLTHIWLIYNLSDPKAIDTMVNTIFNNFDLEKNQGKKEIQFDEFVQALQKNLYYLPGQVNRYFRDKFYRKQNYLLLPKFIDTADYKIGQTVLSQGLYLIFYLNGIGRSVQDCDGIYLLYSSQNGTSSKQRSFAILGYDAPTLVVIKHRNFDEDSCKNKICILGAYNAAEWEDKKGYQGSTENFLFSVYPNYKQIAATFIMNPDLKQQPYSFLNSKVISTCKVGMGFGGDLGFKNFRLWIDDQLENCYCESSGPPYEYGCIIDPSIGKLSVVSLEIWGVGNQKNMENQIKYRQLQQSIQDKMKRVDKAAFSTEIINFTNIFKHREQLREDIDDMRSNLEDHINEYEQNQQNNQNNLLQDQQNQNQEQNEKQNQ